MTDFCGFPLSVSCLWFERASVEKDIANGDLEISLYNIICRRTESGALQYSGGQRREGCRIRI
jgi:hypothetical protein